MLSIFDYGRPWNDFITIDNDIYYVTKINNIFGERIIERTLIPQNRLQIKEIIDETKAIARYMITGEDLAVTKLNNKWLV